MTTVDEKNATARRISGAVIASTAWAAPSRFRGHSCVRQGRESCVRRTPGRMETGIHIPVGHASLKWPEEDR
ncbi:hypothetical protein [Streptomyces sp. NPDC005077]|uniref:hypothetical protein n=1 Tax=Streptomyces sp. NPDC005077 TaxID=3154292 RepID=UPI0033AB6BFE